MTTLDLCRDGWMAAWDPGEPDRIAVGPWPDRTGWSDAYLFTDGCCMTAFHGLAPEMQVAMIFIVFNTIVVRDGIDLQSAHAAFLNIAEYRRRISRDMRGAAGPSKRA